MERVRENSNRDFESLSPRDLRAANDGLRESSNRDFENSNRDFESLSHRIIRTSTGTSRASVPENFRASVPGN